MAEWVKAVTLMAYWKVQAFELLEYMRKGLQAYTWHGKRVVDSDRLERAPRQTLDEIVLNIRAKQHAWTLGGPGQSARPPLSEGELLNAAQLVYQRQSLEIRNPPEDCFLMSYSLPVDGKKAREVLTKIQDFQFRLEDVASFEMKYGLVPEVKEESQGKSDEDSPDDKQEEESSRLGSRGGARSSDDERHDAPKTKEGRADQVEEAHFKRSQKNKNLWAIQFKGKEEKIRSKGMGYVAFLLSHPEEPFEIMSLDNWVEGVDPELITQQRLGDDGRDEGLSVFGSENLSKTEIMDQPTRDQFKKKCQSLKIDLEKAKREGDPIEVRQVQEELDSFIKEVSRSLSPGQLKNLLRGQRKGSIEVNTGMRNEQKRISKLLKDTYKMIGKSFPPLETALSNRIKYSHGRYQYVVNDQDKIRIVIS